MASIELGRLEKVDLRHVFPNEATAFTPWLAEENNLALLGDAIGLDLELEAQEKSVGPFSADILCKDTATDKWVLIENQIEKTDHTHLGQLLTYAAGLDAVTIIWIAETFSDQHRAALDWLNEKTDDNIRFFGLEIELWQIGNSEIAPKFNIRSQPNDFTQDVRTAANQSIDDSELKQLQLRFWMAYKQAVEEQGSPLRCQKVGARNWISHAIGRSGFHVNPNISSGKGPYGAKSPEVHVDLIIRGRKRFDALETHREEIESRLGFALEWYNPPENTQCRVLVRKPGDYTDENQWPELINWLKTTAEKFYSVIGPIVKNLDGSEFED